MHAIELNYTKHGYKGTIKQYLSTTGSFKEKNIQSVEHGVTAFSSATNAISSAIFHISLFQPKLALWTTSILSITHSHPFPNVCSKYCHVLKVSELIHLRKDL